MNIIGNAKDLGVFRFQCEPEDIQVTVDGDLVEIRHTPTQAAVYYLQDELEDN